MSIVDVCRLRELTQMDVTAEEIRMIGSGLGDSRCEMDVFESKIRCEEKHICTENEK